uniref:transposase n=1 Tax=Janibacter hoylei TaxID=364298 RepID=UPI0035CCEC3A
MDDEREQELGQEIVPGVADLEMQTLAAQLVAAAGDRGIELTGTDGLLTALTRQVLQSALEAEMTTHLGYDKLEVSRWWQQPQRVVEEDGHQRGLRFSGYDVRGCSPDEVKY